MFYKVVNGLVAIPAGAYLQESKPLPINNHPATYKQQARTQYYQYRHYPGTIPEWNHLPETTAMALILDNIKSRLAPYTTMVSSKL